MLILEVAWLFLCTACTCIHKTLYQFSILHAQSGTDTHVHTHHSANAITLYSGIPLTDTHDITDNSESPDHFSIDFNTSE